MKSDFSAELLNAYVDGELSASENADIANAIAVDAELARQVAILSSLKAATAAGDCGLKQAFDIDLEGPVKKQSSFTWVAVVASIVLVGVLLAALIVNNTSLLPNQGLRLAEEVHKDWLDERAKALDPEFQKASFLALDQLQIDAYVPDLTKVNLAFSGVRKIASGKSKGMHIGYQGPNGCMVSLVVLNNTVGLSSELAYFEKDGHLLYGWQVKKTGFYLLAYKMDSSRLAEVARVVNRLTRDRLPLDPESIIALEEARSSSTPCLA